MISAFQWCCDSGMLVMYFFCHECATGRKLYSRRPLEHIIL